MSFSDALAPDAAPTEFAAMADPSTMTVTQLREELNARGMDDTGLKSALQARLKAAIEAQNSAGKGSASLKRKRDSTSAEVVPATIVYLRRGSLDILDAIAAELPEVFTEHILPKLSLEDTLALAQVNKAYRDTVWSVGGVQSLDDKIDDHLDEKAKSFGSCRPMPCAVAHGNLPAIRALLEAGVDVNEETTWGAQRFRALEIAAIKGQAASAKALIDAGADVNYQDEQHQETALIIAAAQGHAAVVAVLLNSGANVDFALAPDDQIDDSIYHPQEQGATALCTAALKGHDACVALLLQAGADVHKANGNGLTPMELARCELAIRCEGYLTAKKELAKYKYEKVVTLLRQAAAMRR